MGTPNTPARAVPTQRARVVVAAAIATIAALLPIAEHLRVPQRPSDFGIIWFGARSLIQGTNPYPLVGPGKFYEWDWDLLYPATSMVVALPFAWMPEFLAAAAFVWVSTALLAYGVTKNGWDLLFLFPSSAFIVAARAAQWSPLYSAAFCIPLLGFFLAAKPNVGGAFALASDSGRLVVSAIAGGLVLSAISLILLPAWPKHWIETLAEASHLTAPILTFGGFTVLLTLIKWRRPEARLILLLACIPQTGSWYDALPLLLVAATRRESQVLSLTSSLGFLLIRFIVHGQPEAQFNREVAALMVAFAYLPATIVVLRRPNEGSAPAFLLLLRKVAKLRS